MGAASRLPAPALRTCRAGPPRISDPALPAAAPAGGLRPRATSPIPTRPAPLCEAGTGERAAKQHQEIDRAEIRTQNQRLKRPMLYRLSYPVGDFRSAGGGVHECRSGPLSSAEPPLAQENGQGRTLDQKPPSSVIAVGRLADSTCNPGRIARRSGSRVGAQQMAQSRPDRTNSQTHLRRPARPVPGPTSTGRGRHAPTRSRGVPPRRRPTRSTRASEAKRSESHSRRRRRSPRRGNRTTATHSLFCWLSSAGFSACPARDGVLDLPHEAFSAS